MSDRVLTSIIDLVEQAPKQNNRKTFERLWNILENMRAKIDARFELRQDPASEKFNDYKNLEGCAEGTEGSLKAYTGPEVDWFIHSYIGSPESSFTNMHITLSLGPQSPVPHFGFALGTIPDLFMYMDYLPREELSANLDYMDKYYADVNEEFLELQADARFRPFVSRDLYTRVALTPTAVCYNADIDDDTIDKIEQIAYERLDRWLQWVDEAEATPLADRPAIAARDEQIRKNICLRDPANKLAENMFGKDNADEMVSLLWGGNRTLPRPTGE